MIKDQRIDIVDSASPHFLGCWSLENPELCERLIAFFETNAALQTSGKIGANRLDSQSKNSIDITIEPKNIAQPGYEVFQEYFDQLHAMFRDYCGQWEFLKSFLGKSHIGNFNMQKYEAGGHFNKLHSERTGLNNLQRVLVWMTYLNDVTEGGETDFVHQAVRIKPETGKTLIWPADWTHAHRGCEVLNGPKYIMTGWFDMPAE